MHRAMEEDSLMIRHDDGSPWSVCGVVVVPYAVRAVVAVTVMHVLLFVLHVCVCAVRV